jgi:hypothetical protein
MKYLKKYKLYESYINPISDYLTDFIDLYDFEIDTPEMGVCELTLKSDQYDAQQILSLYQELISRLEDDDYELKGGAHECYPPGTYISFYKKMVHIRIERIVFKRLLELDDVYGSKENRWIEGASQEELREKYK